MKTFNAGLLASMMLFAGTLIANAGGNPPDQSLSSQIGAMLAENPFVVASDDLLAEVKFTLNENKEIVVLTVHTKDKALDAFVKGRLNYQKVVLQDYREGRVYTVPVRITA